MYVIDIVLLYSEPQRIVYTSIFKHIQVNSCCQLHLGQAQLCSFVLPWIYFLQAVMKTTLQYLVGVPRHPHKAAKFHMSKFNGLIMKI